MNRVSTVSLPVLLAVCLLGPGTLMAAVPGPVDLVPIPDRPLPWHMTSYMEDAGLEGSAVFVIDFEPDGTTWVAASDGLYRYDGYHWTHYTTDHGLPSNYVRCVRVTRGGELWVGTDRGAGVFDGESFDPRDTPGNLAGPSVRRIVEDPDGTLWFACDKWPPRDVPAGLTRYRQGAWTTWRVEDGLPSDYVSDVFTDSRGQHFVLTRSGLARLTADGRFERPIEAAGVEQCRDYAWSMAETPAGELIVTTSRWSCVGKDGSWHAIPSASRRLELAQIARTRDGAIPACTTELGATFLEWQQEGFVPVWRSQLHSTHGVQYIVEAPDGSVWVGGPSLLARWERRGSEWRSFEELPSPQILDADGGVWFGSRTRVLRLDRKRWSEFPGASPPLVLDASNAVWMRSAAGLARWSGDGLERFGHDVIGVVQPRYLKLDRAGALWVVGRRPDGRDGVARHDGETWSVHDLPGIRQGESVVFAAPDSGQGMWCVVQDTESDRYRLVHLDATGAREVPLPMPASTYWMPRVLADASRRLWLYGWFGLYLKEPRPDPSEWREITELPGREVRDAIELEGEIWFSHAGITGGSGGVTRLRDGIWSRTSIPTPLANRRGTGDQLVYAHSGGVSIVTLGSADAPQRLALPETLRIQSIVPGPGSDFWFGTSEGVLRYRPDGVPPETVIAHGTEEIRHGESLNLRVRGVERFKPSSRTAYFNVAVQLDDGPWGEFGPLRDGWVAVDATAAGDHVVRVRVQDQGGDVDSTPAEWHFHTHPVPLQERAWFEPALAAILLAFLLLAGASIVASRRESRQRRKKQELEHEILGISEREQHRIGRDLHDGLGQQLTAISFQCHGLHNMLEQDDYRSRERLKEIEDAVRSTIADARVLAHALYPADLDHEDIETVLGNLVAAAARGFDGSCTYRHGSTPEGLTRDDNLNVYRIVQEALNNAMRHSAAETIEVELDRDNGKWCVSVRDNGRGFDVGQAGDGLGLRIMRYRADQLGGKLAIDSLPARGTTVRCEVPVQ